MFTKDQATALLDEEAAGKYLGLRPSTLQQYRSKGTGPNFVQISHNCIRYFLSDLISWAESKKRAANMKGIIDEQ